LLFPGRWRVLVPAHHHDQTRRSLRYVARATVHAGNRDTERL